MKSSLSLIKTIITTNFIIAGCSFLFFSISRSLEPQSVAEVTPTEEEQAYHREVKAQISDEQRQLQQQQEKLSEQEQQIQSLNRQLAQYQQLDQAKLNQPFTLPPSSTEEVSTDSTEPLERVAIVPPVSSPLKVASTPTIVKSYQPSQPPTTPPVAVSSVPQSPKNPKVSANIKQSPSKAEKQQAITQGINYANDIVAGLLVAQNWGQIRHGTKQYNRYQSAIRLLRQGKSLEEAAKTANIPLTDLYQVIAWGENRPGNTNKHHPPILSAQTQLANWIDEPIRYANDIAAGLLVADRKGQINHGTIQYKRVQTAIKLLRQGNSLQQASYRSNVSIATLKQLIKWGEIRPGNQSIDWHQQISSRRLESWQPE